jgi:hypothetical protein
MNIIEFPRILPPKLCDDIIKKLKYETDACTVLQIPKHSKEWEKVEVYLYKQLLIHLRQFRDTVFIQDISNPFLIDLNKEMKIQSFQVVNYNSIVERTVVDYNKQLSRFNLITFVYFLTDIKDFVAIQIKDGIQERTICSEKGKLAFLQENLDYTYTYHIPTVPYSIITGQIILKNRF